MTKISVSEIKSHANTYEKSSRPKKILLAVKNPFKTYAARCLLEQTRLNEQMTQKERLGPYAALFEKSNFAVALGDGMGNIIAANPAFCKLFGYAQEELEGKHYTFLVHEDGMGLHAAKIKKLLAGGTDYNSNEMLLHTKDGTIFWGDTGTVKLPLNNGKMSSVTVIMDITAKKELESELAERMADMEKTKSQLQHEIGLKNKFMSVISHDLRTPFQGLIGFSEILETESYENDEDRQRITEMLHSSAKSTYKLLDKLLAWANLSSGKMKLKFQRLDLAEIVREQEETLHIKAQLKDIRLLNSVPDGLEIFADWDSISTVIRNLASNAIKFTPRNGLVEIGAEANGGSAMVWVSDTGTGIAPDIMGQLFKEKTSTRGTAGEEGTGLGLMLVKEFVEKNNGSISVESEPGKGSKFVFTVPLEPAKGREKEEMREFVK